MPRHGFTFALVIFLFGAGAIRADDAVRRAAASLYDGIRTETLPNGLQIIVKAIPGAPVVTTMTAYRVGSADEELDATGLSHYLEHLMFKGTDKLMPGDIDRMTQRSGGRNNAYTNEDFTNYHFDFPADQWETALKIEADRMRNLRIDERHEFEQEKGAVIAELDRNEDQPFELESKALLPLLFGPNQPYGHPVIGMKSHVRNVAAKTIQGHYDRWYHPNNAVLIVTGGVDADKVFARARELFGSIPAGKLPERKRSEPLPRSGIVRKQIPSKFEVPRMIMAFDGVRVADEDYSALTIIQAILSGGKTSRLYQRLVENNAVASDVSANNSSGRYPGWFGIYAELLKGQSPDKAETAIVEELRLLAAKPVSADELQRVQRALISSAIFSRESVHELAESIAQAVMRGNLDQLKAELPKLIAVTPADIQRVAAKYLNPDRRVVVWSIPEKAEEGAGGKPDQRQPARRRDGKATAGGGEFAVEKTRRVVLPNGLTLLLLENHRLPIFVAEAIVKGTRLNEPAEKAGVAAMVGDMLDEGAGKRSSLEIATAIENVGGALGFSASGGAVRVLSPDRSLGLELLLDGLMRPTFPTEALERKRAQTLSAIDENSRRADTQALRKFRETIYGPKHPLGRPAIGLRPIVEKLTVGDLKEFHAARFVPNNTVLAVVGDFSSDELIAEVKRLTADWKPIEQKPATLPSLPATAKHREIMTNPDAAQSYVHVGHAGIRRDDPDYYKLLVMDHVLGMGSGFTDRLSSALRDRLGLAYTVSASITADAAEEPGMFDCFIGTFPDKLAQVERGIEKELERLRTEEPTSDEVKDAKTYLQSSLAFRYTTSAAVADELLRMERFGLGFDHPEKFRQAIGAVTPTDVLNVARKHIVPEKMATVAAGPIDREGRPLRQEK